MLYHFLVPFAKDYIVFNVFRYLTFRSFMAMITALVISLLIGPWLIRRLKTMQHGGATVREDTPERHQTKKGTPTMGGVIILIAILATTILWANLTNRYVWVAMLSIAGFGLIGMWDDWSKVRRRRGIPARVKLGAQVLLTLALLQIVFWQPPGNWAPVLAIPFFKGWLLDLGFGWFVFAMLVVIGASNAVNLTDGLDGLAGGCLIFAGLTFVGLTYIVGHKVIADYVSSPFVPGCGELAVVLGAMVGAMLGFLWFNCYPAQVFMGDTGSLSLGALLALGALACRQEVLLVICGGVFVVEAAIVKDVGTIWEQNLPHRARDLAAFAEESEANRATFEEQLRYATLIAPKLTIQGGTTEILRGIIARGLGLR